MEKQGRVQAGVTPSEVSGAPSEKVVDGQALTHTEEPAVNTIEKVASLMDDCPRV